MRHWTPLAAALVFALGAPSAYAAPAAQPAAPVVTVDGVAITKAEYDRKLARLKRLYADQDGIDYASPASKQAEANLKKQLLDALVDRQIALNEAARRKIVVSPAELEAAIDKARTEAGSDEIFQANLTEAGVPLAEYRHEMRLELTRLTLIKQLTSGLKVTETEIKAFYDQYPQAYVRPEQACVRAIMVSDEAKAKQLWAELKGGADFATLAREHSEDLRTKEAGGNTDFFDKGQTSPAYDAAAFKLKPGELSDIIAIMSEFYILQGVDRRPARRLSLAEARVDIESRLRQHAEGVAFSKWVENARAKAKVVIASAQPKPTPAKK